MTTYTCNWSEEYVNNMYRAIGIHHPHQLNLEEIAARNGIEVHYAPAKSINIGHAILLDDRLSQSEQWQDFGHELCHALWHCGNQITMPMPYRVYQEAKANNFAQYTCIPTFMMQNLNMPAYEPEAVWMLQEKFGVEREFARKRLHQYLRNLYYG